MAEMTWSRAVELIEPHVVRISTPRSSGTGFLISNGKHNDICGVATAAHVVDHAHFWEEPIRIDHLKSGKSVVIRRDERAVLLDIGRDTAAILFARGDIPLPSDPLALAPKDMFLKVGNEIGWLGFPAIPAAELCFFRGTISAWIHSQSAYLVDGVAINGVSGGPAFHVNAVTEPPAREERALVVMGVVSAYVPNRATGDILPGLSVVRDVAQFHELAPTFANLDQAREAQPPADLPLPSPEGEGLPETQVKRAT
jgi:hypothetical protein